MGTVLDLVTCRLCFRVRWHTELTTLPFSSWWERFQSWNSLSLGNNGLRGFPLLHVFLLTLRHYFFFLFYSNYAAFFSFQFCTKNMPTSMQKSTLESNWSCYCGGWKCSVFYRNNCHVGGKYSTISFPHLGVSRKDVFSIPLDMGSLCISSAWPLACTSAHHLSGWRSEPTWAPGVAFGRTGSASKAALICLLSHFSVLCKPPPHMLCLTVTDRLVRRGQNALHAAACVFIWWWPFLSCQYTWIRTIKWPLLTCNRRDVMVNRVFIEYFSRKTYF